MIQIRAPLDRSALGISAVQLHCAAALQDFDDLLRVWFTSLFVMTVKMESHPALTLNVDNYSVCVAMFMNAKRFLFALKRL